MAKRKKREVIVRSTPLTALLAALILNAVSDWYEEEFREESELFLLSEFCDSATDILQLPRGATVVARLRAGLSLNLRERLPKSVKEREKPRDQAREYERRSRQRRKTFGKRATLATQLPLLVC